MQLWFGCSESAWMGAMKQSQVRLLCAFADPRLGGRTVKCLLGS